METQIGKENVLEKEISSSWKLIAPFWPLQNLIAVNPMQGFEEKPFEEALTYSGIFTKNSLPNGMQDVNRVTIKWLQAYFDQGQASISLPFKEEPIYSAIKKLLIHDTSVHENKKEVVHWIALLPTSPLKAISECLKRIGLKDEERPLFFSLLLASLPGWASYVKYKAIWEHPEKKEELLTEYLALRALLFSLLWPEGASFLPTYSNRLEKKENTLSALHKISSLEKKYQASLLQKLSNFSPESTSKPKAQLAFCIDTRSEPFRKALEETGPYETFGYAGFFGIPMEVVDPNTKDSYASCPALLTPAHKVEEASFKDPSLKLQDKKNYEKATFSKRLGQSLKYGFLTPFPTVECLGFFTGIWTALRTFSPKVASVFSKRWKKAVRKPIDFQPNLATIDRESQHTYAENALRMMGLTDNFSPYIILCAHGSTTCNNAHASYLDCGACGGRKGDKNAKTLAAILNQPCIRERLKKKQIFLPETTKFLAAMHDTTKGTLELYTKSEDPILQKLRKDLQKASIVCAKKELEKMPTASPFFTKTDSKEKRAANWAETRPEWGLAKNAAFIVGPRILTKPLDLEGRCFLHSYDPAKDPSGTYLETILTAPMIVAQWINAQYLFASLDPIYFGAGSKVTKNVIGKFGVMQGNASDLMTGLPLQSVYKSDAEKYHEPLRLLSLIYAPKSRIISIIEKHKELQKLLGNAWIHLLCLDPSKKSFYSLETDFSWKSLP